jgi:glycosyltransferase involved in cell wall biosynthesis
MRDNYNLIIVGKNGWGNINLKLIISQLNLNSHVKIFQNINDNQLAFLYKYAYLSIYPSFYEGCGLPILESNGFGTPTVVSDIEPMNSLCPSSSIVFNPFDVDSIARSIYLAITDVELYSRLKSNSLIEIRKYSWKKSANELYEFLIN